MKPHAIIALLLLVLSSPARAGEPAVRAFWVLPGKEKAAKEVDMTAVVKSCRIISQNNQNSPRSQVECQEQFPCQPLP